MNWIRTSLWGVGCALFSQAIYFFPLCSSLPNFAEMTASGFEVNLKQPSYVDGVLFTDQGGVISNPNMRLQALKIRYVRKTEQGKSIHCVEAEDQIIFTVNGRTYTGKRLEYDLEKGKGVVFDGCTSVDLWFVGGEKIEVSKDGSCSIHNGWATTNENQKSNWAIRAGKVQLSKGSFIKAQNVRFLFIQIPVLWLPTFSADLQGISKTPFKYHARWGGRQGTRLGISYDFRTSPIWNNQILLDVNCKRGLGGGILTRYRSKDKKERLTTTNYVARDVSVSNRRKRQRYRFQGVYDNIYADCYHLNVSYDKVSDRDMPSDFSGKGFETIPVGITQARLWRREPRWLASISSKVRINNFQTVKQKLPLFHFHVHPFEIGHSGWISHNQFEVGFLELKYARGVKQSNFHSSRLELNQSLYRPFYAGIYTITPEVGYTVIGYDNSPHDNARLLALGQISCEMHTRLVKNYPQAQHAIEPYIRHTTVTHPNQSPNKHYMFDLHDGLYKQHVTRFGLRHSLMRKIKNDFLQKMSADLYGNWFHNTSKPGSRFPRAHLDLFFKAHPRVNYFSQLAWNLRHNRLDLFNLGTQLTINEDIALTFELRHRSSYYWRKLDPNNYMLDFFRSERELKKSALSDQRNTLLSRLFYRLTPSVCTEFIARCGFNRKHESHYIQYEANLMTIIRGALRLKFSYKRRRGEDRFDMAISLGAHDPSEPASAKRITQINTD